jgi:hypothetical protein
MKLEFLELPDAERHPDIEKVCNWHAGFIAPVSCCEAGIPRNPGSLSHVSTDDCLGSDFRQSHSSSWC